ncbi:MAG: class I SAM-dependent methyltransferase [Candidatus Bathyarchaeota archaeon]|jgi:ubiquinone/menaquinone biosynthesis C-methylase UbiE|nr:class I SAM-dependent methyltransferase [Candidatus Bathyarchaeota archaeon A05DMB-3]MDH7606544.1 class I SAM-dependent methyltransferase [Candidatus Bathyarchaeota archaeon]
MLQLDFDERAEKIIKSYLRDFECEVLKFDIKPEYLQTLLFELENQIKFHSFKTTIKRGSKVVEEVDVAKTLKTFGSPKALVKHAFQDVNTLNKKQSEFFKIKELLKKHVGSGRIVLDTGCGWGRFILRLWKQCRKSFEMVGVDIDDISLKYGKKVSKNLNVVKSKVEQLPFKDSTVDVILCSGVIHEIKTLSARRATIEGFHRVLKPNGMLCIVDAFSTNLIVDALTRMLQHITSKIEWFFMKSTMEKMLERNSFKTIELFDIERRVFGALKVFVMVLTKNSRIRSVDK